MDYIFSQLADLHDSKHPLEIPIKEKDENKIILSSISSITIGGDPNYSTRWIHINSKLIEGSYIEIVVEIPDTFHGRKGYTISMPVHSKLFVGFDPMFIYLLYGLITHINGDETTIVRNQIKCNVKHMNRFFDEVIKLAKEWNLGIYN